MQRIFLYIIVFVAGAAVLAVEILGTRILGPFYGVSLFLWSALITVTLVALSAGYVIGGRWADRGPQMMRLCLALMGAGIWLLGIPWIKYPLLNLAEPLGLRGAVLVAAFVLFAPPLTLLGMVSPYAIRVRAAHLHEVGRTAGDLYAISTIGSVIAALLTGFFLIPNFGVNRLMVLIGSTLLVTAAAGFWVAATTRRNIGMGVGALLICAWSIAFLPAAKTDPARGFIAIEQSSYAEIRVVDVHGRRHLLIDGGVHTIADPLSFVSLYPYVAVMELTREFFDHPGRLLLIGLGGGSIAKNFAAAGWEVAAVEIDPVVTRIARRYFGLKSTEAQVFHRDGRQHLMIDPQRYDVIIMDAFGSSSIPFHLVTTEAFAQIAARLNPGGVFAINIESNGWEGRIVKALAATLAAHFSTVMALPAHERVDELGNVVLLAANRELQPRREIPPQWETPSREYLHSAAYRRDFAWKNRLYPETAGVPVITDDFNPVDLWSEEINVMARKGLHRYFGKTSMGW